MSPVKCIKFMNKFWSEADGLFLCFSRHEELVAKGSHYADMWQQQLQMKQTEEEDDGGENGGTERKEVVADRSAHGHHF